MKLSFNDTPNLMKFQISSRELEILRKSADGFTAQQIASELNLSVQAISRSQKDLLLRTGQPNLLNALQTLARRGFVLREERIN